MILINLVKQKHTVKPAHAITSSPLLKSHLYKRSPHEKFKRNSLKTYN